MKNLISELNMKDVHSITFKDLTEGEYDRECRVEFWNGEVWTYKFIWGKGWYLKGEL